MEVALIIIIAISFLIKKSGLVYWMCVVILFQNILSILDFENKRYIQDESQNAIFLFKQFITIVIIQVCLNFILNNSYLIFFASNFTALLVSWGMLTMLLPRDEVVSTI